MKAQTTVMQVLPSSFKAELKAEIVAGVIENVKNHALVMEADVSTAAEAIRSYLKQTGKDISMKENVDPIVFSKRYGATQICGE